MECLKQLEDGLKGMVGQYVFAILVEHVWHTTGNGGGFGPSGYDELRQRELSLGVLSEDKIVLDMEDGHFGFRTNGMFSWIDSRHKVGLHPGDMRFERDHLLELPAIIRTFGGNATLDLIIGTDKVLEWLEHGRGIPIDFRDDQFGWLAMKIQTLDELPPKLAEQQRQRIEQFNADVAKAKTLFESSRAKLLDVTMNMSNNDAASLAVGIRGALNDLKRLQKVAEDLGVDTKPIAEYLDKING